MEKMLSWLFGQRATPERPRYENRLKEIEETVESLERTIKSLRLEWDEMYDKLTHMSARIVKRAAAAAREQGPDTAPQEALERTGEPLSRVSPYGNHATLAGMRRKLYGG